MANVDESQLLELLEIYMDLTEKQDVAIYHMSKVISKQATEIQHYKNLLNLADFDEPVGLQADRREMEEAVAEYESAKRGEIN